jgi:hypothetical protein
VKARPRYPIYVPSKGRADRLLTARAFLADAVDFKVVVEPQEVANYAEFRDRLLVLPENDRGLVYARNWIKDHSVAAGHERHWQFDDDIYHFSRLFRGYRIEVEANVALAVAEDFTDRYENVALTSFNSDFLLPCNGTTRNQHPPFYLNQRIYTCFLVLNSLPNRWRQRYNEDTDMTLQVLAAGWCTVLLNAFMMKTPETMAAKGGQTSIYVDEGRLKMARQLERVWPGVVTTMRRFGRPQHSVKGTWQKFDTPLRLKPEIDLARMKPNDYGLKLRTLKSIRSHELRKLAAREG